MKNKNLLLLCTIVSCLTLQHLQGSSESIIQDRTALTKKTNELQLQALHENARGRSECSSFTKIKFIKFNTSDKTVVFCIEVKDFVPNTGRLAEESAWTVARRQHALRLSDSLFTELKNEQPSSSCTLS